jgi:hypothetical protein
MEESSNELGDPALPLFEDDFKDIRFSAFETETKRFSHPRQNYGRSLGESMTGLSELLFRLKQFDQISRWINHPDLRTARAAHDVLSAKLHSGGTKSRGFRVDV